MEQHKHGHLFREKDIDRVIARYGNKPGREVRARIEDRLESCRGKFQRLQQYREQTQQQSRGMQR